MDVKPIHTQADHRDALAELERLWEAKPGTPEGDKFEVLATLVDVYEREHTPILPPDPIEAIKFRMEQEGVTRQDLAPMIGSRARVSEILNGQRRLTLRMIRQLNKQLRIPLEALVAETHVKSSGGVRAKPRPAAPRRQEPSRKR